MATKVIYQGQVEMVDEERGFSWFDRYVLRRFHPRSIFIDTVGLVWFTYYFWAHDWISAVGVAIVGRVIAILSVMNIDTDQFAKTVLGKIGLLHLNPVNLVTQFIGTIVLLIGLWEHSAELILGGISIVLLGHLFGWARVDHRLADRQPHALN